MDAYKKLVLVQLLADGRTSPVPKYTPQAVTRTFKQLAQPYSAFVAAYERRGAKGVDEVHRIAEEKREAFEKDRNVGLVRRCLAVHRQRRIQRLGEVYSALSLHDIAVKIGVEGADAIQSVYADVQEIVSARLFLTFFGIRASLLCDTDWKFVLTSPTTGPQRLDPC